MPSYRSEGLLWCPSCYCKQEFIATAEAVPNDMYPPIECTECGYVFDKVTNEKEGVEPAVSIAVRDKARAEKREQIVRMVTDNGYRLENLKNHGN